MSNNTPKIVPKKKKNTIKNKKEFLEKGTQYCEKDKEKILKMARVSYIIQRHYRKTENKRENETKKYR